MPILSNQEAKAHLKIDDNHSDEWLSVWIPGVEQAILSWLKEDWRAYVKAKDLEGNIILGSDGNPTLELDLEGKPIPLPLVKAAALLELAQHFRFRDGSGAAQASDQSGWGYTLGVAATSLLRGLRKPGLA